MDSLRMAEEAGFLKVHAFKYSESEGTRAEGMKDQVPGEVKNERSDRLIGTGAKRSQTEFFWKRAGRTRTALFGRGD